MAMETQGNLENWMGKTGKGMPGIDGKSTGNENNGGVGGNLMNGWDISEWGQSYEGVDEIDIAENMVNEEE